MPSVSSQKLHNNISGMVAPKNMKTKVLMQSQLSLYDKTTNFGQVFAIMNSIFFNSDECCVAN